MGRYIEAEWLLNFFEPYPNDYQTPLGLLRACVDDAPSIDIVRCKECKHWDDRREDDWWSEEGACLKTSRLGKATYRKHDDFCSYGERRTEIEVYNGNADKENWQCITIKSVEDKPQTEREGE